MIVIGLSGWKGSGKDTAANHMINEYSYTRVAFADSLKKMTAKTYNLPLNCFFDQKLKEVPLMQYPVEITDDFTKMVIDFLAKEFRTKDGRQADCLTISKENQTIGLIFHDGIKEPEEVELFWTPRALLILEGSVKRSVTSDFWVQQTIDDILNIHRERAIDRFVVTDMRYRSEMEQLEHEFGDSFVSCRIKRHDESPSVDPSERDLDNTEMDYILSNRDTIEKLERQVDDLVYYAEESLL